MAAQEYYLGAQGAHELPGNHQVNRNPPRPEKYKQPYPQSYPPQHLNASAYATTPPPTYSAMIAPDPQPQQGYSCPQPPYPEKGLQLIPAPYPQTPPAGYCPSAPPTPQWQQHQTGYLGAPPQPFRSHSQPPRVRFADQESDRSTSLGSISDSDASPPRHHHPRHRNHERIRNDRESDYSDRERPRRHKPRKIHSSDKPHEEKHKTRDTFLGAGAGTLIGDAIFPGLGTAAGLVLGGYGGRKYAEKSKSERDLRGKHSGSYEGSDDGYGRRRKGSGRK
ncbi:hypothetical protein BDW02DRAFT_510480 [Decorospora gaudefroyi]|uniref:Glycine zipper 2TM domain-containing protein n=1 Tax=Decorospora gaudefroyi TaxID=184978 RepID=A0A6A5JZJ4_9PLEO|nr:hypothetical protein BDW02DRAFT_510480 [Decorospora gaudefroyi]